MENTVLELDKLTKRYKKNTVVKNVSLKLQKGHICGLIGPNGAGKTTIMRMIAGLSKPDGGTIKIFGGDALDDARRKMSFMLEAPIIDPSLTAYQNMQYVRYVKGVADEKKINKLLEFTGIADTGKKLASHLGQ